MPKSTKQPSSLKQVVIKIRDVIKDEIDMDMTDGSTSTCEKPQQSSQNQSIDKRKHCLRDQKTKKRSRVRR